MGANRTTFEKLQRDRAKKAKAEAKRQRRMGLTDAPHRAPETTTTEVDSSWEVGDDEKPLSAQELLTLVEQLHAQFEAKAISFEEFEERKTELMARISVD